MTDHTSTLPNASRGVRALCLGGVAALATFAAAQQVQAQQLCATYEVSSGDTLSGIANRAGVSGGFQTLFLANTQVLDNPNRLQIGQVLTIPCADGTLPGAGGSATTTTSAQPAQPAPAQPTPAPARPVPTTQTPERALRVVTASGYAPFTHEDLPGGGFFTQLVRRALELGNADQQFTLFFVNDWGSQLDSLLPSGAIDMAFPWFRPDCSRIESLSEASAYRCSAFNHSDPFYDALVGYYTSVGSPYATATSYDDIRGSRLCRPTDWFTFDLEAEQLMPPNVELIRAPTQTDCWELMQAGEVDVISYDALPAVEDFTQLGLTDQTVVLDDLASRQTLHVFVSKDNAFANEALPILNAGLEQLRLSGEWFSIVSAGSAATVD